MALYIANPGWTDTRCISCNSTAGEGKKWQLCPVCRGELMVKHERHVAYARPSFCAGCGKARPTNAPPGVYCRQCAARWGRS